MLLIRDSQYKIRKAEREMNKIYQGKEDHFYFEKPAEELAHWLLGKILCRRLPTGETLRFRILETEAYGDTDSACHANKYKTGNAVVTQRMIGGTIYVHYRNNNYSGSSFDIVAGKSGEAESVLIRGAVDLDTEKIFNQIELLGEALHIDYETLNQAYLLSSKELWLEDDGFPTDGKISTAQRIGLDAADIREEDKTALKRYILQL